MVQMPEFVGRGGMRTNTPPQERRRHRRHLLECHGIKVSQHNPRRSESDTIGQLVDMSSGGVRIRTSIPSIRPDQQIRVRLDLPAYAGICPFVDTATGSAQPKNQWVGWLAVSRVNRTED